MPAISRKINKSSVKSYGDGYIKTGKDRHGNFMEIASKDKGRKIIIKRLESDLKKFRQSYRITGLKIDKLEDMISTLSVELENINIDSFNPLETVIFEMEDAIKALKANEERD